MTTIAWDGKTIAADRQATAGSRKFTSCKLFRFDDGTIVGFAGILSEGMQVVEWIENGMKDDAKPEVTDTEFLVAMPEGACYMDQWLTSIPILDGFYAIGSGAEYALAALHLGKSAREAIKVASQFDPGTGRGIDEYSVGETVSPTGQS